MDATRSIGPTGSPSLIRTSEIHGPSTNINNNNNNSTESMLVKRTTILYTGFNISGRTRAEVRTTWKEKSVYLGRSRGIYYRVSAKPLYSWRTVEKKLIIKQAYIYKELWDKKANKEFQASTEKQ